MCERRTNSPYDTDALEFFEQLAAIEMAAQMMADAADMDFEDDEDGPNAGADNIA